MNGNAVLMCERKRALARVLHDLDQMLAFLRDAQYQNTAFALGLELPPEAPLITLMGTCVQIYRTTETTLTLGRESHETQR